MCRSCHLRTENRGYNTNRFTNIGQQTFGKVLPGLKSHDSSCDILIVGEEYSINVLKARTHPVWWCWCNFVGDVSLAHFGPLSTN